MNEKPQLMSDGRFITSYISANELTENIKKSNNISNPNDLRLFIQHNGNIIKQNNINYKFDTTKCSDGWFYDNL